MCLVRMRIKSPFQRESPFCVLTSEPDKDGRSWSVIGSGVVSIWHHVPCLSIQTGIRSEISTTRVIQGLISFHFFFILPRIALHSFRNFHLGLRRLLSILCHTFSLL